jgi:hypothetical protein
MKCRGYFNKSCASRHTWSSAAQEHVNVRLDAGSIIKQRKKKRFAAAKKKTGNLWPINTQMVSLTGLLLLYLSKIFKL